MNGSGGQNHAVTIKGLKVEEVVSMGMSVAFVRLVERDFSFISLKVKGKKILISLLLRRLADLVKEKCSKA